MRLDERQHSSPQGVASIAMTPLQRSGIHGSSAGTAAGTRRDGWVTPGAPRAASRLPSSVDGGVAARGARRGCDLQWCCASLAILAAGLCGIVFATRLFHQAASPQPVLARSVLGALVANSSSPVVSSNAGAACCQLERWACSGTLPWWSGDVIYQIYPRSFADSDGDGVGDVPGILQHIDYLVTLNITAVWLSPIFPSPMRDFGYDVTNHTDVDPLFGTLADVDALIAALHARGIRLLLDLVPNHTSDQHPWFVSASSSRSSPYRDFYVWVDPPHNQSRNGTSSPPPGPPPNNWKSFFGGSAWSWEPRTRAWYLHQYLPQQPDLNWRNPAVAEAFHRIMRFWLSRGVDGFRVDSLPTLLEDARLRDEPPNPDWRPGEDPFFKQVHLNVTQDVAPLQQLVHTLRLFADESAGVLVCETSLPPKELEEFYFGAADDEASGPGRRHPLAGCQLPFFFGLIRWTADWNAARLRHEIVSYLQFIPSGGATPTFVLSNHDNSRVSSRLGGQRQGRAAMVLLLMLPGTPTVYYGEELSLRDAVLRDDQVRDPSALRRPQRLWATVGRDPERAPMPWNGHPPAGGFTPGNSSAVPWLPLPPGWNGTDNVAAQAGDSTSSLTLFRQLTALRREHAALRGGPFVPLDVGDDDSLLAYARPLRCNCGDMQQAHAQAPPPGVMYPPDVYERPVAEGTLTAFVTVLNVGNSSATVDVAKALVDAGMGDDLAALTRQGMTLTAVIDSVDVTAHTGEAVNATAVAVQPWQACVFAIPLFPRKPAP